MPIPSSRGLRIPYFYEKDDESRREANLRALDRWANGQLPAGDDLFYQTPQAIQASTRANETITLPAGNDYQWVRVEVESNTSAADSDIILVQINGDAVAAHYLRYFVRYDNGTLALTHATGTSWYAGIVSDGTTWQATSTFKINSVNGARKQQMECQGMGAGATTDRVAFGGGTYLGTLAPLTSILVFPATGSVTSPTHLSAYGGW